VEARELEAGFIKLSGHQALKVVSELPASLGADFFVRRLFTRTSASFNRRTPGLSNDRILVRAAAGEVRSGSWLCKNAASHQGDRIDTTPNGIEPPESS
jgi:hypothetical protein